jgi:transposase
MDYFAGLDVSVKDTSVCIVDDAGKIVREVKVTSEPHALLAVLNNPAYHFKRIGLEAGPLSQWLFSSLAEAGLPVICVLGPSISLIWQRYRRTRRRRLHRDGLARGGSGGLRGGRLWGLGE